MNQSQDLSALEFEETCLASEESSEEESEKTKAANLVFCMGHCDQLVSRSTFYHHQTERHNSAVDSEEEELSISGRSSRSPSESYFDEALPVPELELTSQRRDSDHSVDEETDMDHNPTICSDSESVSSFLKGQNVLTCSFKIFGILL